MTTPDEDSDNNDELKENGKDILEDTNVEYNPDSDNHDEGESGKDDDSYDTPSKKRKKDLSEEEKLEGRRAANRKSALESRLRRKNLIESLQKQVDKLSKETTEMRVLNENLRKQLETALSENQHFRLAFAQQQWSSGLNHGLSSLYSNPSLLNSRAGIGGFGIGGVHPAFAGMQSGLLGNINPGPFGSLGSGFLPFPGISMNTGLTGTDLHTHMQLQAKKRDAIASVLTPSASLLQSDLPAGIVGKDKSPSQAVEEFNDK
jgi:hypothetical protein